MTDFWGDVREDVLRRLHQYAPTMPFEMKVRVAEAAAREVEDCATPYSDGTWPLSPPVPREEDAEAFHPVETFQSRDPRWVPTGDPCTLHPEPTNSETGEQ